MFAKKEDPYTAGAVQPHMSLVLSDKPGLSPEMLTCHAFGANYSLNGYSFHKIIPQFKGMSMAEMEKIRGACPS